MIFLRFWNPNVFLFLFKRTSCLIWTVVLLRSVGLTHACDDAVHGQPGGGVIEASARQTLAVLLLLLEDEGRVLLLGDVDVVAGVRGRHDVARPRVQEDALVVLPLHADQTNAIPERPSKHFSTSFLFGLNSFTS